MDLSERRRRRSRREVENSSETLPGQAFFHFAVKREQESGRRSRQSSSETLPGSVFLAQALSCKAGDITNISLFEASEENMPCFVTSCCEGKEAKVRGRTETSQI